MFGVDSFELLVVGLVALVVIGPKDMPRVMRVVGRWAAKARRMAQHFRSGIDEVIRQSELEEMNREWAEHNARIMRDHPTEPKPLGDMVMPDMAQADIQENAPPKRVTKPRVKATAKPVAKSPVVPPVPDE